METVPSLLWLFGTFFYVGLFTIGGGLVAVTLMEEAIVQNGIISAETFYNMVAISESTPGPLGINMATYVGYNLYGIPGALITSIAEVLPSLVIIMLIAKFLQKYSENKSVKTVLSVIRPVSTGIVIVAAVNIFLLALVNLPASWADFDIKTLFELKSLAAYAVFAFVFFKFKVHPVFIMIAGAVFGMIFL